MSTRLLHSLLPCLLVGSFAAVAQAQDASPASPTGLELSLGTVKEKVEGAAVSALVRFGDKLTAEDQLTRATAPVFYAITRKVEFDVTDKGTFAGVALRYGFKAFKAPLITHPSDPSLKVTDSRGWMHVFPVTLGLDADRSFKNRDVLLEAGYVPFKGDAGVSCFKLGGNPIVGLVGQLGRRTRDPALDDKEASLRRVKLEFATDFALSCLRPRKPTQAEGGDPGLLGLFADDIGSWRVMFQAVAWRDYTLRDSFRHAALTLRVPTGKGAFMDFKREVGAEAPTFTKGAQFGAYLTVQY